MNDDTLNEMEVVTPVVEWHDQIDRHRGLMEQRNGTEPFRMGGHLGEAVYKVAECDNTGRRVLMLDQRDNPNDDEDWLCIHHTESDVVECLKCGYPNAIGSDTFTIRADDGTIVIEWACRECQADLEVYGIRFRKCENFACEHDDYWATVYCHGVWMCENCDCPINHH